MLSQIDLSQILIFVVDDNKFIRRLVSEILRNFNARHVVEAEDGADALAKLKVAQPDIIFCDWMMEPMSGIELLRKVRSGVGRIDRKTPVVMITGQVKASQVVEARDAGVTAYLAKPITVDGVMTRLLQVIRSTAPAAHA